MAKKNDGMRGKWHTSGLYWFCDCRGAGAMPLLSIGDGQGGLLTMQPNALGKHYCSRCQTYRPLKKDKPDLPDEEHLPHGILRD